MSNSLIDREITQGVIPIGTPKAYKYDAALVEAAKASVQQGIASIPSVVEEEAQPYVAQASQYATNASNSASSASTTATQLMDYLATKETITAPAVDPTITISGAAADAQIVGNFVRRSKTSDDVNLIAFNNPTIYQKAGVINGTKNSYTDTSATFTISNSSAPFNAIFFGYNTSVITLESKPYSSNRITVEFDINGTAEHLQIRGSGTGEVGTLMLDVTSGHNKFEYSAGYDTTFYFFDGDTSDATKTFTVSNFIMYQGTMEKNPFAYDKSALTLANSLKTAVESTEDVNIICFNTADVYANSAVLNGTKQSYDYNSVTFKFGTTTSPASFNAILFGYNTTSITIESNAYSSNRLVVEFDIETTANTVLFNAAGGGLANLTKEVTNGHYKFEYESVRNYSLFFSGNNATDPEATLKISNFIMYQGTMEKNPFAYDKRVEKEYKTLYTIGDSLTNINGNAGTGTERWQRNVVKKCGFLGYSAVGGVGFTVADFSGQTSIWDRVNALTRDNNVDFITFWGGTNDWAGSIPIGDFNENIINPSSANFTGAVILCVRKLLDLYPDKHIIMIGTTPRGIIYDNDGVLHFTTRGWLNDINKNLSDYNDVVKQVAEYYSLPYIDLTKTAGINDLNYDTFLYEQSYGTGFNYYLHFTDEGEIRIGNTIAGFINSILGG